MLADGTPHSQTDTFAGAAADSFEVTFGYDGLNRLTSASNGTYADRTQGFSYTDGAGITDLNGNIQSVSGMNAGTFSLAGNQVATATWTGDSGVTTSYSYLANGVLSGRTSSPAAPTGLPDLQCTIVEGGILPSSITVDDQTLQFAYDVHGNRVGKRVLVSGAPTATTLSVPGKVRPLAQVASGTATAFVYSQHDLVAMARGGDRYAVATDALGSVRAVFDAAGDTVAVYDYLAYGALATAAVEPAENWLLLRFTGAELDPETGLYNFNARLYDPALGRFCAPDPKREYPSPYVYVGGQPNRLVDPHR